MANTYVPIATTTVGSGGAANIEFTSIPQTYTDLLIKVSSRSSSTTVSLIVDFNGSTSNQQSRYMYGNGTSTTSALDSSVSYIPIGTNPSDATANTFSNAELYIPNYTSSNYKSSHSIAVTENNATLAYQCINANLWSNTAAITSIKLTPAASNSFAQYSTAYLYGIKKD